MIVSQQNSNRYQTLIPVSAATRTLEPFSPANGICRQTLVPLPQAGLRPGIPFVFNSKPRPLSYCNIIKLSQPATTLWGRWNPAGRFFNRPLRAEQPASKSADEIGAQVEKPAPQ
jgi:hypothetical protein